MNPNSHYYLAFNVGYPNAYDRAYGRTGGAVMVHGVCSSAGCFSMTDEQVADIYAIARDAFRGGQREIQLQSYPFRMTPENMAKYRLDPNIAFWKELKNGSDHFEVAKTEPPVVVCGKHYVFGATANGAVSASAPCPALHRDDDVETQVAEKESKDDAKVAELAASGVKAIRTVYADGGQNPVFAGYKDTSDPESLVGRPAGDRVERRGEACAGGGEGRRRRRRQAAGRDRRCGGVGRGRQAADGRGRLDGGRRTARAVGLEHPEREEMAAFRRPGPGGVSRRSRLMCPTSRSRPTFRCRPAATRSRCMSRSRRRAAVEAGRDFICARRRSGRFAASAPAAGQASAAVAPAAQ